MNILDGMRDSHVSRRVAGVMMVLLAMVVSVGCGGRQTDGANDIGTQVSCAVGAETRVSIATGNSTGVYYSLGNAFAEQLSAATDGKLKATAAETGASMQNIQQLVDDQYQVAFSLFDTATDAVNGTGAFTSKQPVQALARIYDNYTHVVVRTDSGIVSVADLKGKVISTGSPESGTEVIANRLLQTAGLDPETDIAAQHLDLAESIDGMKDGSIDGLIWSGGLPTPGITDLVTTHRTDVKFIDSMALLPKMQEINPAYRPATIPAATYATSSEMPTILVPNVLLVKDTIDADTACVLTKTLFDRKDELVKANAAATGISLAVARNTDPVPLNRGASTALDMLGAK